MKVPESYYDEIFAFAGQWDVPSSCGLKIRENGNETYVIVTELYQDNPGTSVTAAGWSLANQICEKKQLDIRKIHYIECNPDTHSKLSFYDEAYYEVGFFDETGVRRPVPVYTQLAPEEVRQSII